MCSVSFMGETSGSVGKRNTNYVSFSGGETSGSVGKKNIDDEILKNLYLQQLENDTVCFRQKENKSSSAIGALAKFAVASALVVAGLGYAHKTNIVSKMKDGKIKDFLKKSDAVTEPCHNFCHKIKEFCTKPFKK